MQQSIQKIVVIGPESTGKSTLSQALAEQLHTVFVPEYARIYLEQQNNYYEFEDLRCIAAGQLQLEESLSVQANQRLICDTDLYVIAVWSSFKYGKVDDYILQQIATRHYDAYILCDVDMPWQPDPQREHPDQHMRRFFFNWYKELVLSSGRPFLIVSGGEQERLQQVLDSGLLD
jgi:NadR type nicotinamide-nucleotide adenylyltransferase